MRVARRSEGGFTVIEILVAMIVLSIAIGGAATFAVGAFHQQAKNKLREQQIAMAEQSFETAQADQTWTRKCTSLTVPCTIPSASGTKQVGDTTYTVESTALPIDSCADNAPFSAANSTCANGAAYQSGRDFDATKADFFRISVKVTVQSPAMQLAEYEYTTTVNSTLQKVYGSLHLHICEMQRQIDERLPIAQCNNVAHATAGEPNQITPLSIPPNMSYDEAKFSAAGKYVGYCFNVECVTYAAAKRFEKTTETTGNAFRWWTDWTKTAPVSTNFCVEGPGRLSSTGSFDWYSRGTKDAVSFCDSTWGETTGDPGSGKNHQWGEWYSESPKMNGGTPVGMSPGVYQVWIPASPNADFTEWESHAIPGLVKMSQFNLANKYTYVNVQAGMESSASLVLKQKVNDVGLRLRIRTRDITLPWKAHTVLGTMGNSDITLQPLPVPFGRVNQIPKETISTGGNDRNLKQTVSGPSPKGSFDYWYWTHNNHEVDIKNIEAGLYAPMIVAGEPSGWDMLVGTNKMWMYPKTDAPDPKGPARDPLFQPMDAGVDWQHGGPRGHNFDMVWIGGKHWRSSYGGLISMRPENDPHCTTDVSGPTWLCTDGPDGRDTFEIRCRYCDQKVRDRLNQSRVCDAYPEVVWLNAWDYWTVDYDTWAWVGVGKKRKLVKTHHSDPHWAQQYTYHWYTDCPADNNGLENYSAPANHYDLTDDPLHLLDGPGEARPHPGAEPISSASPNRGHNRYGAAPKYWVPKCPLATSDQLDQGLNGF